MSVGLTFVRDEDGVTLAQVLLRDTKRGDESPVITVSPVQWAQFRPAALAWNTDQTIRAAGLRLMNTRMIGAAEPVCISTEALVHLHFGLDEWLEFAEELQR